MTAVSRGELETGSGEELDKRIAYFLGIIYLIIFLVNILTFKRMFLARGSCLCTRGLGVVVFLPHLFRLGVVNNNEY